jgi:hypothetical protein
MMKWAIAIAGFIAGVLALVLAVILIPAIVAVLGFGVALVWNFVFVPIGAPEIVWWQAVIGLLVLRTTIAFLVPNV